MTGFIAQLGYSELKVKNTEHRMFRIVKKQLPQDIEIYTHTGRKVEDFGNLPNLNVVAKLPPHLEDMKKWMIAQPSRDILEDLKKFQRR